MSSGSPLDDPQSFCRASPRSAYSSSTLAHDPRLPAESPLFKRLIVPRRRNDLTRQSFVLVRFKHLDLIPVTRSRTAQRPAGATDHRSRKTEREVFQPQPPCDEGLVVAIFSRRKTRAAFLDIRPRQPGSGFARPRVSLSGHA